LYRSTSYNRVVRIHDRALLPRKLQTPAPPQPAALREREEPAPAVAASLAPAPPAADAFPCERCGTPMYRMHAVWRCPSCRFKTDCCGW
jgi:rubrerythrin